MYLVLFTVLNTINALSWVCQYDNIDGPVYSHFLYKEDNVAEVKWLESYEYCRAKGDKNVYFDAGKGKCEYSRGICLWGNDSCYINPDRGNDPYQECVDLIKNNILVDGLDNGRSSSSTIQDKTTSIFSSYVTIESCSTTTVVVFTSTSSSTDDCYI